MEVPTYVMMTGSLAAAPKIWEQDGDGPSLCWL